MNFNPAYLLRTQVASEAQELRLNIIANNIANIATPGFKRDVPVFEGFILKATATHFSQGDIQATGNKLDLALQGPGFFQIETPNGIRYTRNGAFTISSTGQIVNMEGYPVVGPETVPEGTLELTVTGDGRLLADEVEIGQFELLEFEDTRVLAKEGYNNFRVKVEGITGTPAEETTVQQGALERSNFNVVQEMINLIDTIRTFEAAQKVILSFEEADQKSINDVGRLF